MKGYFKRPGKYGSRQYESVVVSDKDVEKKKIFVIDDFYANYFLKEKIFVAGDYEDDSVKEEAIDIKSLTVRQLKEYAVKHKIDIGKAEKKEDLITVIETA